MRKLRTGGLAITLLVMFVLVSCTTMVNIETDVPGAVVKMDNKTLGKTPVSVKMSNAFWETQDVVITKDGYKTIRTELDKELKGVPIVAGIFLVWWPWLWAYGPDNQQYFELEKE